MPITRPAPKLNTQINTPQTSSSKITRPAPTPAGKPTNLDVYNANTFVNQPKTSTDIKTSSLGTKAQTTPARDTQGTSGTLWKFVSKQLMKPVGTVAAETEAVGQFLGTGKPYLPGKAAVDILRGKTENSFTQIWTENAPNIGISPRVGAYIGLALDIAADPLNFIGTGLTTKGNLAAKATSLSTSGKEILAGSKLARQIEKEAMTAEDLVLGQTKAEQAAKGQRALVTFLGKPIIKGEKVYSALEAGSQFVKATPAGKAFLKVFSTRTGTKEFDDLMRNFDNLAEYRKAQVIEKAVQIQKKINTMDKVGVKLVSELVENPALRATVKDQQAIKVANELESMFRDMKTTEQKVGVLKSEIENYFPHIKTKEKIGERINYFFNPKKYSTVLKAAKGRTIEGTVAEINAKMGKDFFETNPALSYAIRGTGSAKAVTAKEFLMEASQKFFVNAEEAPISYISSTNPLLEGLKAPKEIVDAVDQYIQGIKPDELNAIVKGFDSVQNLWKAQALVSPSYHIRNEVGNLWNNWLAGVRDPLYYSKALSVQKSKNLDEIMMITDAGEQLTRGQIKTMAEREGVIGGGQYAADIQKAIDKEVQTTKDVLTDIRSYNPLSKQNILLRTNLAIGSAIEDNSRLAHFIQKLKEGYSSFDAGQSVKKYLFDYKDLTWTERNVLKRVLPFYTWTSKNIPIQLENLVVQPVTFAAIPKVIQQIESNVPAPDSEKYFSDYIKTNIPVRVRQNAQGNYEYFLLGNWLPGAQAIDFLSQPLESIIDMVTPGIKAPIENFSNRSLFFKNTLGEYSKIDYYKTTEFLGQPMTTRTANLLRNIRVLNDIDKWVSAPAAGDPENSWVVKFLNTMFGKASTYDVEKSKMYYNLDTKTAITEKKAAIKSALKKGDVEYAKKLQNELIQFIKERGY